VTAQPRFVVYRYIVGRLVTVRRGAYRGVFCARCARLTALRASLVSALVGWWGFPMGPVCSVAEIVRNAFGGYEPPGSREILLWQNASAFASRGQGDLAYAIARDLRSARNGPFAPRAAKLMHMLKTSGVSGKAVHLKQAWLFSPVDVVLHLGLAVMLPAILALAAVWIWRGAT
jgi:hypothetical protein